jgi:hypothetical protein
LIEEAIDSQLSLALHSARGATWSATGELSFRLAERYTLLARLRGGRSYGFRYVATALTPAERTLLAAAWPASATQVVVRRAAHALWIWTRHDRARAEHVLDRPLVITIDADALLAAIERISTIS